MISSEVQRTLVKSPPELWAELSDPESLAQHLGDLGEIRITRVEPEQLVEWEAENRTGKVQIKASGWGTRVTLSVASEIPQATPPDAPALAAEPENPADLISADASHGEAELANDSHGPTGLGEPADSSAGTPGHQPAAASWQEEPEQAGEIPSDDPAWPADSDPAFAPAAAASTEPEDQPICEFDAEPAETEMQLDTADADTVSDEPYPWPADEELQPRRGFFARLFGRRPRGSADELKPAEAIDPICSSEQRTQIASGDSVPEAVEAVAELQRSEAPEAEPEAPEAAVEAAQDTPDTPAAAREQAATTQTDEQADEARLQTEATEQAEGISAELRAAEESTDDQVTAVLTSVLDRLGAAHHRPFSRS
jgi:hypothetical protein